MTTVLDRVPAHRPVHVYLLALLLCVYTFKLKSDGNNLIMFVPLYLPAKAINCGIKSKSSLLSV